MRPADQPGFLIFAGSNDRAALALCRGFSQYGEDFGLIGRGVGDLLLSTKYASRFVSTRSSKSLALSDVFQAVAKARRRYGRRQWVICPTSEYLNRHLLDMREALLRGGVQLALCGADLYREVSDKARFRSYCLNAGLETPAALPRNEPESQALPFVAKPAQNLGADDRILYPYLVRNERQRRQFLAERARASYYLEQFVTGESWYLLYYFDQQGRAWIGSQRNLLQQGQGKSVLLARAQRYPDSGVAERLAGRLRADGYRGFLMVEVRLSEHGSVILEANPRCWGPLQLTLDARMGLIEGFLADWGFNLRGAPEVAARDGVFYIWLGGIAGALRHGLGLTLHAPWTSVAANLMTAAAGDVYARNDSWACYGRGLSG
jgi:hypothetical protein